MLPGTIALVLFVIVGLLSLNVVRRRHYKLFYIVYIYILSLLDTFIYIGGISVQLHPLYKVYLCNATKSNSLYN